MWRVKATTDFQNWVTTLNDDAKECLLKHLYILEELGPNLGRPLADTLKGSKYLNMKELRVQNKKRIYRVFYIFDHQRAAVLLIGGDKRGDKNFYTTMIPKAEDIYEQYLKETEGKDGK